MSGERQKLVESEEEVQRKHEKNERRERMKLIHHFRGKLGWTGKLIMVQDFAGVAFRRTRVSRGWLKTIIERFSFAFTANGKQQAAACRKSKRIILFYFSVFSSCSIDVTNR